MKNIFNARGPSLLPERMNRDTLWEIMFSLLETNHLYALKMLRELFEPAVKKTERLIVPIDRLRRDQNPHTLFSPLFARLAALAAEHFEHGGNDRRERVLAPDVRFEPATLAPPPLFPGGRPRF